MWDMKWAGPQTEHVEAVLRSGVSVMLDVTRIDCLRLTRWPPTFGSALIVSFSNKRTEAFYRGRRVPAFTGFARTESRKLDQLDAATGLRDLTRPGNRLEALNGRRKGQWSIRINDHWLICFEWPEGSPGPARVEIVDYR